MSVGARAAGDSADVAVTPAGAWPVLGFALIAQVGFSVLEQGIPALSGFVEVNLGLSSAEVGLVVGSFSFGRILASYAVGVAADRKGERRVLLLGGAATAALGLVTATLAFPLLLIGLTAAGAASAASTPAGGRLVLRAFPPRRRGLALGIRQTGIPLGGALASATLPAIAHAWGWRWGLACAAVAAGVCVLPLQATRDPDRLEAEAPTGVSTRTAVRARELRLLTVWACLVITGQYALLTFLALDLHRNGGVPLRRAAVVVAVAQLAGVVGRITWGSVSDRLDAHGRRSPLIVVTAVGLVAALLLAGVPRSSSLAVLAAVAALAGFVLIGYQGLWITMIAEAAGPERVGAATGLAVTFTLASVAASPPLLGLVADVTGTYRSVWIAVAGLLMAAFVPAVALGGKGPYLDSGQRES